MNDEEIDIRSEMRRCMGHEPFLPFVIVMTSGDRYAVSSPLSVALGKNAVVLTAPRSEQVLRWNQISSLEIQYSD